MRNKVDDFTKSELSDLFGELPKSGRRRRILPHRLNKEAMARSDAPFLSVPNDRAYIKHRPPKTRGKSIKVLTIKRPRRILGGVIKPRRTGKMANNKNHINYIKTGSIFMLTLGAIIGVAKLLARGAVGIGIAIILGVVLFIHATKD